MSACVNLSPIPCQKKRTSAISHLGSSYSKSPALLKILDLNLIWLVYLLVKKLRCLGFRSADSSAD